MCIFGKPKNTTLSRDIPPPEPTAEEPAVGAARTSEDEALYGGVPNLRVDRASQKGGATAGGTSLKVM